MIDNPAFIIPVRNKAPYIGYCIRSMLNQTYSPMQLIISDQGSTDGTLDVVKAEVARYDGPNTVTVLNCPETARRGMNGYNAHLNWLHGVVDTDYFIFMSGDDISLPDRASRTVEAIRALDRLPLYCGTGMYFATLDEAKRGDAHGRTAYPTESKWIEPGESLANLVGGSGTTAYSPKLIELMGGKIPDHALQDMYLPFVAALQGAYYFIADCLGVHVKTDDPGNMGLETRQMNARSETERRQLLEVAGAQLTGNAVLMMQASERRADGVTSDFHLQHNEAALRYFMRSAMDWSSMRADLVEHNEAPMALPGAF